QPIESYAARAMSIEPSWTQLPSKAASPTTVKARTRRMVAQPLGRSNWVIFECTAYLERVDRRDEGRRETGTTDLPIAATSLKPRFFGPMDRQRWPPNGGSGEFKALLRYRPPIAVLNLN